MGEEILDFGPVKDTMQGIIKVIGVGGGGCNAVRNMYNEGVEGVTYAVCNTDSQSLSRSPVPVKIMLGDSGLGAGANPELGKKEAEISKWMRGTHNFTIDTIATIEKALDASILQVCHSDVECTTMEAELA